ATVEEFVPDVPGDRSRLGIEIVGHQRPPTNDAAAPLGPTFSSLVPCASICGVLMRAARWPRPIVSTSGLGGAGLTQACPVKRVWVASIGAGAGTWGTG